MRTSVVFRSAQTLLSRNSQYVDNQATASTIGTPCFATTVARSGS